jgi:CRISPR system Cascade subunit CasA
MEDRGIAVSLLTFLNFSLGGLFPQVKWNGKQTSKSGVNDAPCASQSMLHAFIRQDTLVKTIFANTVTKENVLAAYGKDGWGKPVWEWMPQDLTDEKAIRNATETYLGRLVPLSRLIRINNDRMTMLMGEGFKYPVAPAFQPEPTATQILKTINNKQERVLLNIKAKSPFRELHSMTVRRNSGNGGPLTLNSIPENVAFDLLIAALNRVPGQATELDSVESVYHIPATMNCNHGRDVYEKEIQLAESTSFRLTRGMEQYRKTLDPVWEETTKKNRNLRQSLNNKAFALFWTRVEGELPSLFRYVESLGKDVQTVDELQSAWRKTVGRIARESYETLCGNANSRQLKAFVAGLSVLFPEIQKKKTQNTNREEP